MGVRMGLFRRSKNLGFRVIGFRVIGFRVLRV